ncbi:site-specific tyrosine recombinase XerC [Dokdonella soli]|uniref:site-specific tyrosine recombinase XerC n=2 Tax=Dokdonella soli TaxID=529810 RepID=UPI00361732ED
MPRIGHYGERRRLLEASSAPDSMAAWMRRYLDALAVQGYSEDLLRARRQTLAVFLEWCGDRGLARPAEITLPILERYQRHLFQWRKADGEPLSLRGQALAITHLRHWFRWQVRHHHLPTNPAADLDLPRAPRVVLPEGLQAEEVDAVLAQPDVDDVQGLRDRALLELLYSTGVRRQEARNLSIFDLDFVHGVLRVRQGKGRKDRVVPIGERALAWVRRYLDTARPPLVVEAHETALFLNRFGRRLGNNGIAAIVRRAFDAAGVTKRGACHLFRHTMATQMLENGADIRYIQELLGHERLDTTQIYTHVSIGKLKEIHTATHPAAKLARTPDTSSC